MKTKFIRQLVLLCTVIYISLVNVYATNTHFTAICYHDVKTITQGDLGPDQYAISPENLLAQFEWLKKNNYQAISFDDLIAAREGKKSLPPKAVLLTFDDGYISFYTKIYPLLKLYNFPAVFAIVGKWLETPRDGNVQYGKKSISREHFLSWAQLKEMQASGLVEVASHSFNLHRGILANPQKNTQPAAISRQYYSRSQHYETDKTYLHRIKNDLKKNSNLITQKLGKPPRVMVWPYGAYNKKTVQIAKELGMPFNLSLDTELELKRKNSITDLSLINRELIIANPNARDLAYMLNTNKKPNPERVIHVDLDYIYDTSAEQQEKNLNQLLDRIKQFNVNTVYLQAFADPDGDGNVNALYFPNRHLPMRADLFNRVAWQLRTRANVNVYAWIPVMAFDFGESYFSKYGVKELKDGQLISTSAAYKRLSPFYPQVRKIINEIYSDLAKHTNFYGILYHDDAYYTDFEDFSEAALNWYQQRGIIQSPQAIIAQPALLKKLAKLKTAFLIQFTHELSDSIRQYRPTIKTARNMYARPVLEQDSEVWFAQNLEQFVQNYDTTAIMAMPWMEKATDPHLWLAELTEVVKQRIEKKNISKVLFELQAMDWNTSQPIDTQIMAAQVNFLLRHGINNIGYYPDDFQNNHPNIEQLKKQFSLQTFPYNQP
ncbi:poly-beta-1,6-N-acetyl-D-glucosamine N-deacetylase PgaB [sulfur-oxidizing endosymbiont of Gigantopelta aegis]|uniref:poly-beta-1,6-N-acetyl-D-glucosamine N-deacetylase PgaB n=1 Tax=sulfur-oxidizing endosymbiont of Gigantopelta aegis TaxID=2794934 RepID=UPI0018DE0B06|nr:poly-beta-1,6-N-acetyl-D-glucosamine N-deacetylase PgaB [sulfur-oxidizing endosymbiont of Gigantopelta aegis]